MKKSILGKFTATLMMAAALLCGVAAHNTTLAKAETSADFDCEYSINDKTDPFLKDGYGSKEIITYTEEEALAAGIPAGFSGDVVSVVHTIVNRGIALDFSSQNIPIKLVESITFRVYVGDDGNANDNYPELRIPEPNKNGCWVMRDAFATKTDSWQEVVLKDGNGTFFNDRSRTANFNMLSKNGYLYKLELAIRHNGTKAAFYIDSVKLGLVDDEEAPVLTYNGEDVVTIARGQQLSFDVSAVDALEGAVDVEYVWGDPSKIENGVPTEGTNTLTFVARDFFGNTAEKTITVIVEEPDETPPTLLIPVDTIYAKIGARSMLTFEATDDRSDVEITTEWSEGALDARERLTEGTHTLTVTATDLSGNKTQKSITFVVTPEGDTADTIIDEEVLCPDSVEPDSSVESDSSEEPDSSVEPNSSKEPESSKESNSSKEPESSKAPVASENSEASKSESSKEGEGMSSGANTKPGCGSTLSTVAGLPLLALCVCALLKRRKD